MPHREALLALASKVRDDMIRAIPAGRKVKYSGNWSDIVRVLSAAREVTLKLANVNYIPTTPAPFTTVCGDVHGQGSDFLSIFAKFGKPSVQHPYLFNGDLVDRGPNGVEIAVILASLMIDRPGSIYVNRGNHEVKKVFRLYGFGNELRSKFKSDADKVEAAFVGWFSSLPIAHIVDRRVFVTHGGPPRKRATTVADINSLTRDVEEPKKEIFDMLWSDPTPGGHGRGFRYNATETETFLNAVGCEFLMRSHEMKDEGFEIHHGGLTTTVFSAPNYCGAYKNKGAVALVKHGAERKLAPELVPFEAATANALMTDL
jgi:serine/threonine-protein phosphatase 5